MMKKLILSIIALLVVGAGALFAINGKDNYDPTKYHTTATNGINVGSKLSVKLPDQFDKAYEVTDDTKEVIFVFAKATGHTVREYLKQQPKDYLPSKNALFIADISGMPAVIRNTFALPDFKKSPYSVMLIYDKNIAKTLKDDKNADKITIAKLKNKEIVSIKYISTEDELKKELSK
jgi:uncharacterized protein YxeA